MASVEKPHCIPVRERALLPSLPRAKRVAGRGRGWGACGRCQRIARQTSRAHTTEIRRVQPVLLTSPSARPPPPTPPRHPASLRYAGRERNDVGNAAAFRLIPHFASHLSANRSTFVLDLPPRMIIVIPSRSGEGRVAIVFETRSGMRMAATMPDLEPRRGSLILEWHGDRRRHNGRTVQVHVRATARTNGGASAPVTTPGTCSKPQSPFACGTQAKICFRGPVQLNDLRRWAGPLPVCRRKAACGLPAPTHAGAAGAVKRPVVPHAPCGQGRH